MILASLVEITPGQALSAGKDIVFFNFVRGFRSAQPNDFDYRVTTLTFSLEILLKIPVR